MDMKKIIAIIGARPQFIKHFPLELACREKLELVTIHTGQHYDQNMSKVFFDELGMSKPNYQLSLGGGTHGQQTGTMMIEIEKIVLEEKPDYVLVYGDTNSTLAGALVAGKLHIPIVHVEAGLRSYNKQMPEEINRVLTDHISELMFVPSEISVSNLRKEGIEQGVQVVGDIMKDLVNYCTEHNFAIRPSYDFEYYYATVHRPYNTDEKERLNYVLGAMNSVDKKVVFAIHPRTRNAMKKYGMLESDFDNIVFIEPQSYFSNMGHLKYSSGLITDSGGMQKEAYWLQKKCITMRSETEWVETLSGGANHLVFEDLSSINDLLSTSKVEFDPFLYGKANAADLMVNSIVSHTKKST